MAVYHINDWYFHWIWWSVADAEPGSIQFCCQLATSFRLKGWGTASRWIWRCPRWCGSPSPTPRRWWADAVNNAGATCCTPGFWLLKAENANAGPLPTLSWKCTRPLGNTNSSPALMVVANNVLLGPLLLTKPTYSSPLAKNSSSVARGCVCGGLMPPLSKSMRAAEIPSVFSPGNWMTEAGGHGRLVCIVGVAAILEGGGREVHDRHLVGGLAGEAVDGEAGGLSATQKSCRGSSSAAMASMGTSAATLTSTATVSHNPSLRKMPMMMFAGSQSMCAAAGISGWEFRTLQVERWLWARERVVRWWWKLEIRSNGCCCYNDWGCKGLYTPWGLVQNLRPSLGFRVTGWQEGSVWWHCMARYVVHWGNWMRSGSDCCKALSLVQTSEPNSELTLVEEDMFTRPYDSEGGWRWLSRLWKLSWFSWYYCEGMLKPRAKSTHVFWTLQAHGL